MDWLNSFSRTPEVTVAGRTVPIAVKRHATAKRLTMRVAPDGSEIRVTMPRWAQSREATAFAQSRLPWLERQLASARPRRILRDGSPLPYRGRTLRIAWSQDRPRAPDLTDTILMLGGPETGIFTRVETWLRTRAEEAMHNDLRDYCARAALPIPALALSRAKRRWGSCSSNGTLRINWRLIMAPDPVRRSVVAHEVAHLVHFDHSPAFHALLADIYESDLARANRWLKAHGRDLYAPCG